MEYTPQAPKQPEPPKPIYELKKDVTGKPPPVRGPQTIPVVKYVKVDGKEQRQEVKIQVPHAPKSNCKKCHGRGYIGFESKSGNFIPCVKCFPIQK
jgi:hypothetical protein